MSDLSIPYTVSGNITVIQGPDLTPWLYAEAVRQARDLESLAVAEQDHSENDTREEYRALFSGEAHRDRLSADREWGRAAILLLWLLLSGDPARNSCRQCRGYGYRPGTNYSRACAACGEGPT